MVAATIDRADPDTVQGLFFITLTIRSDREASSPRPLQRLLCQLQLQRPAEGCPAQGLIQFTEWWAQRATASLKRGFLFRQQHRNRFDSLTIQIKINIEIQIKTKINTKKDNDID